MPNLAAFRGLGYAVDRFGVPAEEGRRIADLTRVVCPPYDVITPEQQAALLARSDRNAVRVELSAEANPHAAAAETLAAWRADGTLERRGEPALYRYRHARPAAPDDLAVHGLVARIRLEPFGAGVPAH